MEKLDAFLVDRLDAVTAKLQRRGVLLTTAITGNAAVVLSTALAVALFPTPHYYIAGLCGFIWSVHLGFTIKWANENKDYPLSVRMTEKLNSEVLRERESPHGLIFRAGWIYLSLLIITSNIVSCIWGDQSLSVTILSVINMFAASGTCWLRACRFLGPGEFAKNRKTAHGGQYARQNQGG